MEERVMHHTKSDLKMPNGDSRESHQTIPIKVEKCNAFRNIYIGGIYTLKPCIAKFVTSHNT